MCDGGAESNRQEFFQLLLEPASVRPVQPAPSVSSSEMNSDSFSAAIPDAAPTQTQPNLVGFLAAKSSIVVTLVFERALLRLHSPHRVLNDLHPRS